MKIPTKKELKEKEKELGFTAQEVIDFISEFQNFIVSNNEKFKGCQIEIMLSVICRSYVERGDPDEFLALCLVVLKKSKDMFKEKK